MEENKSKYNTEELIGKADALFAEMLKEGRYRELIDAMVNLGEYSLRNQMLIMAEMCIRDRSMRLKFCIL